MNPRSPTSISKRILFSVLACVLFLILLEGLCGWAWLPWDYIAWRKSKPSAVSFKEDYHCRYDSEIGWVQIPGKKIPDLYGPGKSVTINQAGFRGLRDNPIPKPPGKFRVVCLGDSFTLGYGVDDANSYPAQLESLHPEIEAINMGQGGYSIGQCWQWFKRDGEKLDADLLLFAFIVDDISRMLNDRTANGYWLPKFHLREGHIVVENLPIPPKTKTGGRMFVTGETLQFLGEHGGFLRAVAKLVPSRKTHPDELNDERFKELIELTLAFFGELDRMQKAKGKSFALVQMPELRDFSDEGSVKTYLFIAGVVKDFATTNNIPYLDLREAFEAVGLDRIPALYLDEPWHHFSEKGNRLVAETIANRLLSDETAVAKGGKTP